MSISNTTLVLACLFAGIAQCESPSMPWNHADDAPCAETHSSVCDERSTLAAPTESSL